MGQARALDPGASFAACLGAVLRRLRALRGLTQAGLGRLAGYDGSYVGAVERAAVRPSRFQRSPSRPSPWDSSS